MTRSAKDPIPRAAGPPSPPRSALSRITNERGSVLVLAVLFLIVALGLAALAIDLGLLYVARGETQRSSDAGAHAAAVHMIHNWDVPQHTLEGEMKDVAVRVALMNPVRGSAVSVDLDENDVEVLWDEEKVRVRAHRTAERQNAVRTLFAHILGFGQVDVAATAAAEVWPADPGECPLPLAVPDRWCLNSGIPCANDQYSDALSPNQGWEPHHTYISWDDAVTGPNGTPYWTGYSNANDGDPMMVKPQNPHAALQPGWFFPFRIPGNSGARDYRESISGCNPGNRRWGVGDTVYTEQGNMEDPTIEGFEKLLSDNGEAGWTPGCQGTVGECAYGPPDQIANRTRAIVVFDPRYPPETGHNPFEIHNFAAVFVEGFDTDGNVIVRFAEMTASNPAPSRDRRAGSPDLRIVRIVE
jgi:hypothetical protein